MAIILTGIFGGIISVPLFKIIKIKHPIAKGIALELQHALGTTKAIELGEDRRCYEWTSYRSGRYYYCYFNTYINKISIII